MEQHMKKLHADDDDTGDEDEQINKFSKPPLPRTTSKSSEKWDESVKYSDQWMMIFKCISNNNTHFLII